MTVQYFLHVQIVHLHIPHPLLVKDQILHCLWAFIIVWPAVIAEPAEEHHIEQEHEEVMTVAAVLMMLGEERKVTAVLRTTEVTL